MWYDSPPTGSLGLPVTNCRKSLCCSASKLLNTSNRNRTARLQNDKIKLHMKNDWRVPNASDVLLRGIRQKAEGLSYDSPVMCVAMVRSTALHQRLDIPRLWFTATQQLVKLRQERRENEQHMQGGVLFSHRVKMNKENKPKLNHYLLWIEIL